MLTVSTKTAEQRMASMLSVKSVVYIWTENVVGKILFGLKDVGYKISTFMRKIVRVLLSERKDGELQPKEKKATDYPLENGNQKMGQKCEHIRPLKELLLGELSKGVLRVRYAILTYALKLTIMTIAKNLMSYGYANCVMKK